MLAGNFGAQLVSLLFYPLLVRLFTPYDFGTFGTFLSLMVISAIFASGQLHMGFIKTKDEEELAELLWMFRRFSFFGIVFSSLVVFLINLKFNYFPLSLVVFFPLLLSCYILFEASKMLGIKLEKFKFVSVSTSANRFSSNLFKVLLGIISSSSVYLIISEILANFLASLFLFKKIKFKEKKPTEWKNFLKKFSHFPIYASLSNFFQFGLMEFPIIVLALFYNKQEIGYYVLSMRLVMQPFAIIGNSAGSIISKKLVSDFSKGITSRITIIKLYALYLFIGISIFLITAMTPEKWFLYLLGEKWMGLKSILLPLTILTTAKLSSGLHIYYYIATESVKIKSIWKSIQLSSVVLLIYFYHELPFTELLWLTSITEAGIDMLFTLYTINFKIISFNKNH
jgi:O-antigen/teichoic acid export membrane protein